MYNTLLIHLSILKHKQNLEWALAASFYPGGHSQARGR